MRAARRSGYQYLITGLVSGEYTVTFTLSGFSTVRREGVGLSTGFTANVDGVLSVGSVEETITVTGEVPVVDIQNVQQNVAIDRDVIDAIPSGRSFQNLGILIPAWSATGWWGRPWPSTSAGRGA